jgi:hypothetical protein
MQHELLRQVRTELGQGWAAVRPMVIPAVACMALAVATIWWRRARAWQRARAGARWVEVMPPPSTEIADGQAMWRALIGLLRPRFFGGPRRLITWEVHAGSDQVHAGL